MNRRITLRDISSNAGVTVACVSLALRDSPQVSAATKVRIRDFPTPRLIPFALLPSATLCVSTAFTG